MTILENNQFDMCVYMPDMNIHTHWPT